MPYKSPSEVKEKVNGADKLSDRKLRQFMHVFNGCESGGKYDEGRCHAIAWGAVKNTSSKDFEMKIKSELKKIAKLLQSAEVINENCGCKGNCGCKNCTE